MKKYHLITLILLLLFPVFLAGQEKAPRGTDERLISFDFKDTDIKDVLRAIATTKGVNIVTEPEVKGNVTIHLQDVPFETGLRTILETYGFTYEKDGDIYKVKKAAEKRLYSIAFTNGLLSLDIRGADVRDVLIKIAKETGTNIVADKTVTGEVNIHLERMPFERGLKTFLNANGFSLTKSAGVFRVSALEKPPPLTLELNEGLLTINVEDADMGDVIRQIADQGGFNLVVIGQVREKINVKFHRMLLDEALRFIFTGTKYEYRRLDDTLVVGDSSITGAASKVLTGQKLIPLEYLRAEEIMPLLPPTISASNIKILREQNAIVAVGSNSKVEQIERYIKTIDNAPRQVMIEVLVVEFSETRGVDFGISGSYQEQRIDSSLTGAGELDANFNLKAVGLLPEDFEISLQAAVKKGEAEIKASPKIAAINGKDAAINVGWKRYYEVTSVIKDYPVTNLQAIDAGITLKIRPWVHAAGEITTEVHQEVSEGIIGATGLPEITQRTVNTTIRVRDGETIVIGGLIQSKEQKTSRRVPVLGDIPVVGWLFGRSTTSRERTELVTYITPRILGEGKMEQEPVENDIK